MFVTSPDGFKLPTCFLESRGGVPASLPWLLDSNPGLSISVLPHIIDEDGCAKVRAPRDWNNDK